MVKHVFFFFFFSLVLTCVSYICRSYRRLSLAISVFVLQYRAQIVDSASCTHRSCTKAAVRCTLNEPRLFCIVSDF